MHRCLHSISYVSYRNSDVCNALLLLMCSSVVLCSCVEFYFNYNGGELNFGMSGMICDICHSLLVTTKLFSLVRTITNILVLSFSPSHSFLGLCIAMQPHADLVT